MAETMIERIARVLCEKDGGDPDEVRLGEGHAAGKTWLGWQAHASDARDILGVMRDPSEAMIGAGRIVLLEGERVTVEAYQAMIDAAREE